MTTERCTMGVGCDEAGVCYAAAHGQPDQCPEACDHQWVTVTLSSYQTPPYRKCTRCGETR